MEFKELKKNYEVLAKKFKLPPFAEVDDNFEIHKIDRESDALLRAVRKQMMEKIVNSVGFVEMLLSGANAPRMYFGYLKTISQADRNALEKIYKNFSELIISSLELEIEYGEKEEAELIKKIVEVWGGVKEDFKKILCNIRKPNESVVRKERSYFG